MSISNPNEVLNVYLDYVNRTTDFTQYIFASNCLLEWFGQGFRGSKDAYQYLRFNLRQQYEHIFEKAIISEPFEMTEPRQRTMEIPPENLKIVRHIEVKTDDCHLSTPPQVKVTPKLPKLTEGHRFRPMSDDSDLELPKRVLSTPPRAISKSLDDSLGVLMLMDDDVHILSEPSTSSSPQRLLRKRSKSFSSPESLIKRRKSSSQNPESLDISVEPSTSSAVIQKCDNNPSDRASSSSSSTVVDSQYSALQYIESIGILRKIITPKHRGVSNIHGGLPSGHQDRNVKLQISYRFRLSDGDIQFVLVIYEHVVKRTNLRRNLIAEFNETAPTTTTTTPTKSASIDKNDGKKSQTKCVKSNRDNKLSKVSTFKRLRF